MWGPYRRVGAVVFVGAAAFGMRNVAWGLFGRIVLTWAGDGGGSHHSSSMYSVESASGKISGFINSRIYPTWVFLPLCVYLGFPWVSLIRSLSVSRLPVFIDEWYMTKNGTTFTQKGS